MRTRGQVILLASVLSAGLAGCSDPPPPRFSLQLSQSQSAELIRLGARFTLEDIARKGIAEEFLEAEERRTGRLAKGRSAQEPGSLEQYGISFFEVPDGLVVQLHRGADHVKDGDYCYLLGSSGPAKQLACSQALQMYRRAQEGSAA